MSASGVISYMVLWKVGALILATVATWQEIPIGRPLKEDESFVMKALISIQAGDLKVVEDGKFEHKCIDVDDKGIQHIEVTCVDGTIKKDSDDPESMKGEYFNYFQNTFGQRFEYEEIRATLKDDPIGFIAAEIHSKLRDHAVVAGDSWKDKSSHTAYQVKVGEPKKYMNTDCIQVTREGTFTEGMTGTFKEVSWYRISDGQLMYQESTADDVTTQDVPPVQYLERQEFQDQKN